MKNSFDDRCPRCKGTGIATEWVSNEHTREVYGNDMQIEYAIKCPVCNGAKENNAIMLRRNSDIPSLYYDKKLKDFDWNIYEKDGKRIDTKKLQDFVEDFINNYKAWRDQSLGFYIWGTMRGIGKTCLASVICREIMDKYTIRTKFVQATSIIDESKKPTAQGEKPYIDVLKTCELLVLDDIGINNTEWMNSLLFEILDYRYDNQLVTIITSNIDQAELSRVMDDRLADRITSMTQPLPLPNCPLRQREAFRKRREFFENRGLIKKEA